MVKDGYIEKMRVNGDNYHHNYDNEYDNGNIEVTNLDSLKVGNIMGDINKNNIKELDDDGFYENSEINNPFLTK
jgi:hypothetical protein